MKMINFIFLIILGFSVFAEADGPRYRHKEPEKQLEFENIYQDMRRINTLNLLSSTNTWTGGNTFYSFEFLGQNVNTNSSTGSLFLHSSGSTYNRILRFNGGISVDSLIYIPKGSDTLIFGNTNGSVTSTMTYMSSAGVGLLGTNTNDSALSGYYGEYISSATLLDTKFSGTGQYANNCSIILTAGDWDISLIVDVESQGATWSEFEAGIGTVAGNDSTGLSKGDTLGINQFSSSATTPLQATIVIPQKRVSIASTTSYYLKVESTYTVGQPTYRGRISARRMR
jgi:hypothetical protein